MQAKAGIPDTRTFCRPENPLATALSVFGGSGEVQCQMLRHDEPGLLLCPVLGSSPVEEAHGLEGGIREIAQVRPGPTGTLLALQKVFKCSLACMSVTRSRL